MFLWVMILVKISLWLLVGILVKSGDDDDAAADEARDTEARCHAEALFHDTLPHPGFP